ncbi:MAG: TIR domain-containing protein [Ruminiclostridium sp.]
MAVYKCKMCGGTLEINFNETTAICEYCGTEQTLPKAKDDIIGNLFNRANTLRLKSEFDKAEELYNKIIESDNTQAEAYWGIILCKYGVEYVEDPATFKRIPTCHRTSFEAVTADEDYKLALKYADISQKIIYENEARAIDEIQKGILAISQNEKPYDVFICYKETDDNAKRTTDSVIANDIYYQLKQEGFKVFYAAITLEDKLGQEYEPYIFAAINSAKVMLVIGSKPEYFTSVWVKNEWSRFLKLMKSDRSKLLIPCYKDMDAYVLPEEFAHLQAQDMGKIGFINDVVRGIKKVVQREEPKVTVRETVVVQQSANSNGSNSEALLKRGFMFLEDSNWERANEYFEKILDINPECAEAYLGKLMAERKITKIDFIGNEYKRLDDNANYIKALRFADSKLKKELHDYSKKIERNIVDYQKELVYKKAIESMDSAKTEREFIDAAKQFHDLGYYKQSKENEDKCYELAEDTRQRNIYNTAKQYMSMNTVAWYEMAIDKLKTIDTYSDSKVLIKECEDSIERINKEMRRAEEEKHGQTKISYIVSLITTAIGLVVYFGADVLLGTSEPFVKLFFTDIILTLPMVILYMLDDNKQTGYIKGAIFNCLGAGVTVVAIMISHGVGYVILSIAMIAGIAAATLAICGKLGNI